MDGAFGGFQAIALVEDLRDSAVGESLAAQFADEIVMRLEAGPHRMVGERSEVFLGLLVHVSSRTKLRQGAWRTRREQNRDKSWTEGGQSRTASVHCPGAVRALSGSSRRSREA